MAQVVKDPHAMQEIYNTRLGFDPRDGESPWRRAWQPTPVFLPGDSHGQRSLVGCKELDMTELLNDNTHRIVCLVGAL